MSERDLRYVPILRAKQGELQALAQLHFNVKGRTTPLLEVQPIEDPGRKTPEQHFANLANDLATKWGVEHRIFIDDQESGDDPTSGGRHPIDELFVALDAKGLLAVPVTGLSRTPDYESAVIAIAARTGNVCLRLEAGDFLTLDLASSLTTWLTASGLEPEAVDLVIDIGALESNEDVTGLAIVSNLALLPRIQDWRSLTLAMTSFPTSLGDHVSQDSTGRVPRRAWSLYTRLLRMALPRVPDFGDYAVDNPEVVLDIPPALLGARMTAAIRYSTEDDWLIVRGRNLRRFGYGQYRDLSARLKKEPEYKGAAFSWGDDYVDRCASSKVGTGNQTTWRSVAVNHHITLVVEQLSTLP